MDIYREKRSNMAMIGDGADALLTFIYGGFFPKRKAGFPSSQCPLWLHLLDFSFCTRDGSRRPPPRIHHCKSRGQLWEDDLADRPTSAGVVRQVWTCIAIRDSGLQSNIQISVDSPAATEESSRMTVAARWRSSSCPATMYIDRLPTIHARRVWLITYLD